MIERSACAACVSFWGELIMSHVLSSEALYAWHGMAWGRVGWGFVQEIDSAISIPLYPYWRTFLVDNVCGPVMSFQEPGTG